MKIYELDHKIKKPGICLKDSICSDDKMFAIQYFLYLLYTRTKAKNGSSDLTQKLEIYNVILKVCTILLYTQLY